MAITYEKIASVLVPKGGLKEIKFSNIPQNYTDIKITGSIRSNSIFGQVGTGQYDAMLLTVNDTTTILNNYSGRNFYMFNSASGVATVGGETQPNAAQIAFIQADLATPGAFGNTEIYIPNYSANNIEKNVCVTTSNCSNIYGNIMAYAVNKFNSTNPITSILFRGAWGTGWVEGSHAIMYGIRKA